MAQTSHGKSLGLAPDLAPYGAPPYRSRSAHSLARSAVATAWRGSWWAEPAEPAARSSRCTTEGTSRDDFLSRTLAPKGSHKGGGKCGKIWENLGKWREECEFAMI